MKALTVPALIELAKDHNVSTEKLKELIAYNTQLAIQDSIRSFNRAFAKLQAELPIIDKNETITYRDGRVGTYASNDAIQEVVGPICRKHGFTLSFSTTYPAGMVRVIGELAHKDGHSKTSEYEARVDLSGGKTDTQGRGSVISYGHRYTTVDLLNLVFKGEDIDGAIEVAFLSPDAWQKYPSLCKAATKGAEALGDVWAAMSADEREAVVDTDWRVLKSIAAMVDRDA